jgi:hypothetical protein
MAWDIHTYVAGSALGLGNTQIVDIGGIVHQSLFKRSFHNAFIIAFCKHDSK